MNIYMVEYFKKGFQMNARIVYILAGKPHTALKKATDEMAPIELGETVVAKATLIKKNVTEREFVHMGAEMKKTGEKKQFFDPAIHHLYFKDETPAPASDFQALENGLKMAAAVALDMKKAITETTQSPTDLANQFQNAPIHPADDQK